MAETNTAIDMMIDVIVHSSSPAELAGNDIGIELKQQISNKQTRIASAIEAELVSDSKVINIRVQFPTIV